MKARPILFNAAMVRALLDGSKTQTRRIVKPQPDSRCDRVLYDPPIGFRFRHDSNRQCPHGAPGDLLWVRETAAYGPHQTLAYNADGWCGAVSANRERIYHGRVLEADGYKSCFPASGARTFGLKKYGGRWKPSIHMPRWASRITLRVTDVRVERVQDISEEDAAAEGIKGRPLVASNGTTMLYGATANQPEHGLTAKDGFNILWHSTYGPTAWDDNAWVWALTFEVLKQNVDEAA